MRYKIAAVKSVSDRAIVVPEIWLHLGDLVTIVSSATGKSENMLRRQISAYEVQKYKDDQRYIIDTTARRLVGMYRKKHPHPALDQLYEVCLHIDGWYSYGLQNILCEIKAIPLPGLSREELKNELLDLK